MKKASTFWMIFLALSLVCAPALAEMPKADPGALWNHITKVSPYTKWGQWPDYKGVQKSRSPHGDSNQVFVSPNLLKVTAAPAPYGSIQVKEAYDQGGKLVNITVMYKLKGYNPDAGDWFWAKFTPQGQAGPYGKPRGCIRCHGASKSDYITVHQF